MTMQSLAFIPVVLVALTSAALLISRNWRYSILALAIQYVGVFWLTALLWPFGLAAVKLVAGWMAGAILSTSQPDEAVEEEHYAGLAAPAFRAVAMGLVLGLVLATAPQIGQRLPVEPHVLQGGLMLIGAGLLHLGMTRRPMRVILGLLTALSGFELIYAALETSVLVTGLQAMITLALALIGAYLLAAPAMDSEE